MSSLNEEVAEKFESQTVRKDAGQNEAERLSCGPSETFNCLANECRSGEVSATTFTLTTSSHS